MENNNFEMQNAAETTAITENGEMTAASYAARKKQRILLVAVMLCCIAVLATGTLAYFTAEETAYNVITTATLDVDLKEETDGGKPWPEEGFDNIVPGMDVTKIVYGVNNGTADFYVRILLDKSITPAAGVTKPLNFDHITLDINTTDWTEKDGVYYYNKVLKPGEKTTPLFTKVQFGKELGNEYMDAKVVITVTTQAVQAKNNGDSALTAIGWPEN